MRAHHETFRCCSDCGKYKTAPHPVLPCQPREKEKATGGHSTAQSVGSSGPGSTVGTREAITEERLSEVRLSNKRNMFLWGEEKRALELGTDLRRFSGGSVL